MTKSLASFASKDLELTSSGKFKYEDFTQKIGMKIERHSCQRLVKPPNILNDEALTKVMFLTYWDLSKKWSMPPKNCPFFLVQFELDFGEKFTKKLK